MQPNNNNPRPKRPPGNNAAGPNNPGNPGARRGGRKPQTRNKPMATNLTTSRGQAVRAQRRSHADAQRIANQYLTAENKPAAPRANIIDDSPRLKIIGLGGMDGGGSKNMILVEYKDDAVIMDCGNDLGVDLIQNCEVTGIDTVGDRVVGLQTTRGPIAAAGSTHTSHVPHAAWASVPVKCAHSIAWRQRAAPA